MHGVKNMNLYQHSLKWKHVLCICSIFSASHKRRHFLAESAGTPLIPGRTNEAKNIMSSKNLVSLHLMPFDVTQVNGILGLHNLCHRAGWGKEKKSFPGQCNMCCNVTVICARFYMF